MHFPVTILLQQTKQWNFQANHSMNVVKPRMKQQNQPSLLEKIFIFRFSPKWWTYSKALLAPLTAFLYFSPWAPGNACVRVLRLNELSPGINGSSIRSLSSFSATVTYSAHSLWHFCWKTGGFSIKCCLSRLFTDMLKKQLFSECSFIECCHITIQSFTARNSDMLILWSNMMVIKSKILLSLNKVLILFGD